MKKIRNRILTVMIVFVCAWILCGCGKEETEPENVVLLIGSRANSASPNLDAAESYVRDVCGSYGHISMISVEGTPAVFVQADIPELEGRLTRRKRKMLVDDRTQQLMALAGECKAGTEEADLMASIILGARELKSQKDGSGTMILLDSMVSTKGTVNFVDSKLESIDVQTVVEELKENRELPDLTGIKIECYGLGDTQPPVQQPLSWKNREVLEEVWEAILTEAGATVCFEEDPSDTSRVADDLPKVTPVEVIQPASVIGAYHPEEPMVLDQEVLSFKPDSPELLTDSKKVEEMLHPVIEYLTEHKEFQILLCGTTASPGTQAELAELSNERCNTVKQILISSGVSEQQVLTKGLGYEGHPFSIPDTDENGNLVEELARQNRNVIIMDRNSELAEELL